MSTRNNVQKGLAPDMEVYAKKLMRMNFKNPPSRAAEALCTAIRQETLVRSRRERRHEQSRRLQAAGTAGHELQHRYRNGYCKRANRRVKRTVPKASRNSPRCPCQFLRTTPSRVNRDFQHIALHGADSAQNPMSKE